MRGPGRPALGDVVFVALTGLTKQPLMARTGHGEAPITTRSIYHVKAPLLLTFSVIAALCRARFTPRDFSLQLRVQYSHHTFNHQRHQAPRAPEPTRKFGYNKPEIHETGKSYVCGEACPDCSSLSVLWAGEQVHATGCRRFSTLDKGKGT